MDIFKTHIYGLRPRDIYTLSWTDGEQRNTEIETPTLEALAGKLGDGYIPQDVIKDTIGGLEKYGGAFSDESKTAFARDMVLRAITAYDSSANVNGFTIQGRRLWLDRNTRAALMRRFEAEKASGVKKTTLWYGEGKFDMPVDTAIQMLNAIEIYACKCFDVTAAHKAKVSELATIDEVIGYDYKTGYPEQLDFKI